MGASGNQKIIRILTAEQACRTEFPGAVRLYAGQSYQTLQSLDNVTPLSRFFADVQKEASDFLVQIDGSLCDMYADTASHNLYLSSLPRRALRAAAIVETARNHKGTVYIVDTKAEVYLYGRILRAEGFSCPDGYILHTVPDLLRGLRDGIAYFICSLRASVGRTPTHKVEPHKFWFVNWLGGNAASYDDLMNSSRYYGDMAAICAQNHDTGIIGRVVRGSDAPRNIATVQQHRRFRDVICGLGRGLLLACKIWGRYKSASCDMTSLVRHSLAIDILSGRYIETCTDYYAARRFAQALPDDARIIYPFENQPWEKAFLKAFSDSGKGIRAYGYQFFPLPPSLLMDRFSIYQQRCGAMPTAILTSDAASQALLAHRGVKTYPAGSQRYKSDLDPPSSFSAGFGHHVVLCSLFLDEGEAIELALKSILATSGLDVQLWINMHAMTSVHVREHLHKMAAAYDHVEIREEGFAVLASQVSMVLYNSSSVVYDAVLQGVPALYVETDLMPDMNRFAGPIQSFSDPDRGRDILQQLLSDKGAYAQYAQDLHSAAVTNIQIVDNNIWEFL